MVDEADQRPTFEIRSDAAPDGTLLAGFSEFGLAGLTAVDYLVDQLDLDPVGHIAVEQLATITPFENGTPRHHSRLFTNSELDVTVLVGELAIPGRAAQPFADAILDWTRDTETEEVVVLSGVPVAHGPEEHQPYYVASPDYQRERLDDADVTPMGGGLLDGVNGALMGRGIESTLRTCVFTTPVHMQVPDVEAALRLLDALDGVYGFDVDTGPLEAFAEEVGNYYAELADRIERQREELGIEHDDRMYM